MANTDTIIIEHDGPRSFVWLAPASGEEPCRFYGSVGELVNLMASEFFNGAKTLKIQARKTCQLCGDWTPLGQSCGCFDNGGQ